MKFIPYGRQHITDKDIAAVVETLRSDFLTQGPKVPEFEEAFKNYLGLGNCVAVSNGTAALHLAVLALQNGKPLKKVITTPITFAASANCVLYADGEVEFCDIDPQTHCLDLNVVLEKISQAPTGTYSGVIPVALAGRPQNLEKLSKLCREKGIWILEDAAHAPGAHWMSSQGKKQMTGANEFIDAGTFSFHPVKHLTTGEGGMVWCRTKETAEKIALLRTHGISKHTKDLRPWFSDMLALGYNYRLPDLNAALGTSQIKNLNENLTRRKKIAAVYDQELSSTPLKLPLADVGHAHHLYIVGTPDRDKLHKHLLDKKIGTQVHYLPVYQHTYYRSLKKFTSLPKAEEYSGQCLSIPMFHAFTESEQTYVIQSIKEFFR